MGSPQAITALILGVAVIFLAPALVWALVVGGLVRIVRERVREDRPVELEAQSMETEQSSLSQ
jgi:Na+-transporting methylmalonyl-CoA/oxaloacetate decarboxylase gamma subunit